jgi:small GTP-binding protein
MGKSTLLNALIEESLSIISDKPQTTRHSILGILSTNTSQICFYDTPGILEKASYQLQTNMMETVKNSFQDADVILIVTDPYSTPIPSDSLFQKVQLSRKPKLVIINKIDLFQKQKKAQQQKQPQQPQQSNHRNMTSDSRMMGSIDEIIYTWRQFLPDAIAVLPVSALQGSKDIGINVLRHILTNDRYHFMESIRQLGRPIPHMFLPQCYTPTSTSEVVSTLAPTGVTAKMKTQKMTRFTYSTTNMEDTVLDIIPVSPPLYDIETYTDRTERFIASEMIRSILFTSKLLNQELPYCCEVQVTEFKEKSNVVMQQPQPQAKYRRPPQDMNINNNNNKKQQYGLPSTSAIPSRPQKEDLLRISAYIIVERDSQKMIVIGKNGQIIKQIGILAREKLEKFFHSKVQY